MNIKTFFCVLFLFAVLCVPPYAEDMETDFTGQGGEPLVEHGDFILQGTVLVQYRGREEHVTIPAHLGITEIGEGAFEYSELISVIVPEGIHTIGNVFMDCNNLTTVQLPSTLREIKDKAFYACINLNGIIIPKGVTSIGLAAFSNCYRLATITIPTSVSSIGRSAFYDCSDLSSISIPDSVKTIGEYAFAGCKSLTSISIPFSVTSISKGTFYYCPSLTSISIPDSVTTIGDRSFIGCGSLTSIDIPPSVTSIGSEAFDDCNKLETIILAKNSPLDRSIFPNGVEIIELDNDSIQKVQGLGVGVDINIVIIAACILAALTGILIFVIIRKTRAKRKGADDAL